MPATVTLRAVREYTLPAGPCGSLHCTEDDDCREGEPPQWGEFIDPLSPHTGYGWYNEPTDDPGEPIEVVLAPWVAAEIIRDWPGGVWDATESFYSTDCYRTGRESALTLFVEGPGEVFALNMSGIG